MTRDEFLHLVRELVDDEETAERSMGITCALWWVIYACGEKGEHALREYCQGVRREKKDT